MSITPFETGEPPSWVAARAAAWNRMTASGIARPDSADASVAGGKVHNYSVKDGAAAARLYARIRNAEELTRDAPVTVVRQPFPSAQPIAVAINPDGVGGPQGPVPVVPMRQDPEGMPNEQAGPQHSLPQPAQRNPSEVGSNQPQQAPENMMAELGIAPPSTMVAPPALAAQPDIDAVLNGGRPEPGKSITLPSSATVTSGFDGTTAIGTTDPTTGKTHTGVINRFGVTVATAESEIVVGTGGLSRDTIIVDANGVTRMRSVDDGHGNIITWTANPDGSHSVRYADGTIVKEPASGSSTPAEVVQLRPDGLGGHVTVFNLNGTITEADFGPGVLGAPITDVTNPDGSHVLVATIPGQTNSAPYSIITGPDGNRVVLQPDGTTVPIDRYNDVIGGPNYANQFDPTTGTWRTDPITHRGPIVTRPDGTSTQEWFYRDRKGQERSATATFDPTGNLKMLDDFDYTGATITTFDTFDGITLPTWTTRLDAGNVKDESTLVWEVALAFTGIPELGWAAGRMIGTRLITSQLAARGVSDVGIELATSQLAARGATAFTGLAGNSPRQLSGTYAGALSKIGASGPTSLGRLPSLRPLSWGPKVGATIRGFDAATALPGFISRGISSLGAIPGIASNTAVSVQNTVLVGIIKSIAALEKAIPTPAVELVGISRRLTDPATPLADMLAIRFNAAIRPGRVIPPGVQRLPSGKLPSNYRYAGQQYPMERLSPGLRAKYPAGVKFTSDGFPDFTPYASHTVKFPSPGFVGNRSTDFTQANRMAGLPSKPRGWTWHHHQDGSTLQLVPEDLHEAIRHAGGVAIKKGP